MRSEPRVRAGLLRSAVGIVAGLVATGGLFLVLPVMQAIGGGPVADSLLREVDAAELPPPPPPPPPPEPEDEPKPEADPPKLQEQPALPDLAALELATDGLFDGGGIAAGIAFDTRMQAGDSGPDTFSLADLDQRPRPIHQPGPAVDAAMAQRTPARVYVLFVVDKTGRVRDPSVQRSTDPAFERAAVSAVKQWKFEPGRRKGEAVRFRMRVPITFPKSRS